MLASCGLQTPMLFHSFTKDWHSGHHRRDCNSFHSTHSLRLIFSTGDNAFACATCDHLCERWAKVAATVVEEETCMHMYTVRLRNLHVFLWYCVLGLGLALRKQNADGRTHE